MRTPDLNDQLDRLEGVCPSYLARLIHFLREPRLRWWRTSIGVLLLIGGCFWFLPILGLEMIPLGLMLIAIDVPFLRGPVARVIVWGEHKILGMVALWNSVRARSRHGPGRGAKLRS